jgi:hypothetical protein
MVKVELVEGSKMVLRPDTLAPGGTPLSARATSIACVPLERVMLTV